ncbi:polysaccharide deacetylase family protein [Kitasatospora sp. NPDC002551]|uniref:polysaccharide deacetylase family protein n=1 Tax=unclassified Kitasatospora TaxID=2633591 RepID=UPI00332A7FDA
MPRSVRVFLTFDVEDPVTARSDDAVVRVAGLLRERGARAAFFVTGDKARALVRRGRPDVFEALRAHDVGYHTNHHSTHPTVAEYLERRDWADGVAEVVARERSGAELVRELTGRRLCGFAGPGTSWGPQLPAALAALDIPAHLHSFSRTGGGHNPHWYAGALCFARSEAVGPVEDVLPDPARFAELLARVPELVDRAARSADGVLHLYIGHPTMFVNREFWDGLNYAAGRNPAPGAPLAEPAARPAEETRTMLDNLGRLVDAVRARPGAEIVGFGDLVEERLRTPAPRGDWFAAELRAAAAEPGIRTTSRTASPAQLLHAMCGAVLGRDPGSGGPPGEVHGPVARPAGGIPAGGRCEADRDTVLGLAAELCREVAATGALPASVRGPGGVAVAPATLHRGLLDLAGTGGAEALRELPARVVLPAVAPLPEVGEEMAEHFTRRVRRWMHRPDLDVTELARLTRAQTWTLRATAA